MRIRAQSYTRFARIYKYITGTFAEFMARPFAEFQKSDLQRRDTFPSCRRMKSGFVVSHGGLTKFSTTYIPRVIRTREELGGRSRAGAYGIGGIKRYMGTISRREYRLGGGALCGA